MRRAAVLAALAAAGCAHVSELPDGSRRVTGFVSLTIPPAIAARERGADALHVTTLGLLVLSSPAASSVQLGYASDRITAVRNNALVELHEGGQTP